MGLVGWMRYFAFMAGIFGFVMAQAAGQPLPRSGTHYSEVLKNFDGSYTFVNPALFYQGKLLRISAWSKAEGVCRSLYKKKSLENAQIEMSQSFVQSMIVIGASGNDAGTMQDNVYVKSVTCRY